MMKTTKKDKVTESTCFHYKDCIKLNGIWYERIYNGYRKVPSTEIEQLEIEFSSAVSLQDKT